MVLSPILISARTYCSTPVRLYWQKVVFCFDIVRRFCPDYLFKTFFRFGYSRGASRLHCWQMLPREWRDVDRWWSLQDWNDKMGLRHSLVDGMFYSVSKAKTRKALGTDLSTTLRIIDNKKGLDLIPRYIFHRWCITCWQSLSCPVYFHSVFLQCF